MNCDAVKAYLTKLRKEGQISARTFGYYVRDLRAFAKWLLRSRRARENPFEHLEGLGAKALANDATILRRAMTAQETCALLETTANQPVRYEMSGAERSLVYRLAVETGLRASEIASLTKASFRLNDKVPVVFVPGSATKNARDAELPLRPRTAELLREHLSTKLPPAKAFAIPPSTETARMIRADLAATGIPDTDTDGRKVDFHALRHTFLTLLASSGVHPKVAQDLARHSDINLTLSRYSHTLMEQRSEAVARLPNFDKGADQATGTDKK
jgi:integrase